MSDLCTTTSTMDKIKLAEVDGTMKAHIIRDTKEKAIPATKNDLTLNVTDSIEDIIAKIEKYGGVIIKNYLSTEITDSILKDATPFLDQDKSWDGTFFPPETRKVTGMCVRSKTCAEKFLSHPLNSALSHKFLGKRNGFWIGDEIVQGYSPPQHNSTICFRIGPGAKDQVLHRDDVIHHNIHKHMDTYEYGSDSALGSVLGLTRTTKENGATRFIPGSHMWDHWRKPEESEVVYAELEKGDCFFMLASCYHAGSANVTKSEYRAVVINFMTEGTLRQEENIMLGTPIEYFKSLPVETLKLLGLTTSDPFLGYIDFKDPLKLLKPNYESKEQQDFYSGTYPYVLVDNLNS